MTDEVKLHGKVIGCLQDGFVTITIGYGVGMMDGGYPEQIPVELVPPALRLPNAAIDVILQLKPRRILRIEPQSDLKK